MKSVLVIIIAVIAFTGIQFTDAAAGKCYQCYTKGCGDPFNPDSVDVATTDSVNGWCYKEKRVLAGTTTVTRSGFYEGSVKKCETNVDDGSTITTCWCSTDLCNVAQRASSGTVGIFLISFLVLLRYFYRTISSF